MEIGWLRIFCSDFLKTSRNVFFKLFEKLVSIKVCKQDDIFWMLYINLSLVFIVIQKRTQENIFTFLHPQKSIKRIIKHWKLFKTYLTFPWKSTELYFLIQIKTINLISPYEWWDLRSFSNHAQQTRHQQDENEWMRLLGSYIYEFFPWFNINYYIFVTIFYGLTSFLFFIFRFSTISGFYALFYHYIFTKFSQNFSFMELWWTYETWCYEI